MPELPDVCLYVARLQERLIGQRLENVRFYKPFVLRTVTPKPADLIGRSCVGVSRLGKRIVIEMEEDGFIVIHLMIAGRFTWADGSSPLPFSSHKNQLAYWQWTSGNLGLQEASSKKRAGVFLVQGREGLVEFSRAGLDVFKASDAEFAAQLRWQNRTLKRALTDPNTLDGIGNAYSDEILFAARLSPVRTTQALSDEEMSRLKAAAMDTLDGWRTQLQKVYKGFPKPAQVTAFRPEYFVHGRYGQPCRVCGKPIQRIVQAENETNYCAQCQNEGRLLADRSLSKLLKDDWPKTIEELIGE
jgi:formamidopyrimidine-DNA glycosylase